MSLAGATTATATRSRPLPRSLQVLAVALVALAAAAAAMVGFADVRADVGPVQTRLSVVLTFGGGTEVAVPPVGRLSMDTHAGPFGLRAGVEAVDVAAVSDIIRGSGPRPTPETVTADLRDGLTRLAVRASVVAILASVVATALVFRRVWAVVVGTACTVAALAVGGGVAAATFEPDAVSEPTFDGLLAQAPALVGGVVDARAAVESYGTRVTELAGNVAQLYSTLGTLPDAPDGGAVRVLWVSDVHNNPASYRVMSELVQQFEVQAVVDTGDSTDFGTAPENALLDPIAALGVPYLWVRGNHDSSVTQAYLDAMPNVTVLDGEDPVEVAGLRWAGIGDPRYTPVRRVAAATSVDRDRLQAAGRELARMLAEQPEPVDVVLVHEAQMAQPLLGEVPLVLDGHTHRRAEQRVDGTLELTQGSSGGAGLRTFDRGDALPLEMSILHFDPANGDLLTVDEITVAGIGQERVTFERRSASSMGAQDPD